MIFALNLMRRVSFSFEALKMIFALNTVNQSSISSTLSEEMRLRFSIVNN
jgi:hypothetical protein